MAVIVLRRSGSFEAQDPYVADGRLEIDVDVREVSPVLCHLVEGPLLANLDRLHHLQESGPSEPKEDKRRVRFSPATPGFAGIQNKQQGGMRLSQARRIQRRQR